LRLTYATTTKELYIIHDEERHSARYPMFHRPGFTGGYIYGYKFALEPGLRDLRTSAPAVMH